MFTFVKNTYHIVVVVFTYCFLIEFTNTVKREIMIASCIEQMILLQLVFAKTTPKKDVY